MFIVEAQVHLYAPSTPERPWPVPAPAPRHRQEPLLPADFLAIMDEAGVSRALIVPPDWEGSRNDLGLAAARDYPDRFAVIGRIPMDQPDAAALFPGWKQQPGLLGMRLSFATEPQRSWLTDGSLDWFWKAAEREGIPQAVYVPDSLPILGGIAAKYPGLRFLIDHMAIPRQGKDATAFTHLPELVKLAKYPNVAVKATALPGYVTEKFPFPILHDPIQQVVDAFGPQRVFWGTDWTRLPCPYTEAIRLFTEELPFLSESDKEWIMGRGICEWLDWPIS